VAFLSDPERLAAYRDALENWRTTGYVEFELNESAYRWIKKELAGVSLTSLKRLMYEYVFVQEGDIDECRERRPEWSGEHPYHYDLRFPIQGKMIYIETRLRYRLPVREGDSTILVVNIHQA
jgi:hypothetical protein